MSCLFLLMMKKKNQTISFKQGTITDRSELVTRTELVTDFIDLLLNQIDILTTRSYIVKSQAQYLKKIKDELKDNEVIVLGDFAENYSFIVQMKSKDSTGTIPNVRCIQFSLL